MTAVWSSFTDQEKQALTAAHEALARVGALTRDEIVWPADSDHWHPYLYRAHQALELILVHLDLIEVDLPGPWSDT